MAKIKKQNAETEPKGPADFFLCHIVIMPRGLQLGLWQSLGLWLSLGLSRSLPEIISVRHISRTRTFIKNSFGIHSDFHFQFPANGDGCRSSSSSSSSRFISLHFIWVFDFWFTFRIVGSILMLLLLLLIVVVCLAYDSCNVYLSVYCDESACLLPVITVKIIFSNYSDKCERQRRSEGKQP